MVGMWRPFQKVGQLNMIRQDLGSLKENLQVQFQYKKYLTVWVYFKVYFHKISKQGVSLANKQ